jgi:mono/diheme cytochrome c family protein
MHVTRAGLPALHALWTLDGIGALDIDTRLAAMDSADERVRVAAIRLCERDPSAAALAALEKRAADPSPAVRLQIALTLGAFADPKASALLEEILSREGHALFRTAVASGLGGREFDFLTSWLAGHAGSKISPALTTLLAQCILEEAQPARVSALFDLLASTPADREWQRSALLAAFAGVRYAQPLALAREPVVLNALLRSPEVEVREKALRALGWFTWPGAKLPDMLTRGASPLTPEQEKRMRVGQQMYATVCAACHQPGGGGNPAIAPPLAGSDWVTGPPERLVRVVLHGLYGPVEVNGQTWNLHMPALGASGLFDDEKIAGVLSYVRRAWGNAAPPVEPALVAEVRKNTVSRMFPWRAEELAQISAQPAGAPPVQPGANGELHLPASKAAVYGQKLAYRPALDILAPWRVKEDVVEWRVEVRAAGRYEVFVTLAADDASAGDEFVVETEGSQTKGTVLSSGDYGHFREVPAGKLELKAGVNRILMRPEGPLRQELADVRAVRLVPVK